MDEDHVHIFYLIILLSLILPQMSFQTLKCKAIQNLHNKMSLDLDILNYPLFHLLFFHLILYSFYQIFLLITQMIYFISY